MWVIGSFKEGETDDCNTGRTPGLARNEVFQLMDGGKVGKSGFHKGYHWSGDMLIGNTKGEICKMEVKTVGGTEFLLIEKGDCAGTDSAPSTSDEGDGDEIPKDWHCGYHVYIRQ